MGEQSTTLNVKKTESVVKEYNISSNKALTVVVEKKFIDGELISESYTVKNAFYTLHLFGEDDLLDLLEILKNIDHDNYHE